MRPSRQLNERGTIAALACLAIPLLAAVLLLIVDLGRLAVARARLQVAADRAAYAGAASYAASLDRIASANWRLHKASRDLARDFATQSQQNRAAAEERISAYEAARDEALSEIDATFDAMDDRAAHAAKSTLAANAPLSAGEAFADNGVQLDADADRDRQWETASYDVITGPSWIDPESTEVGTYEALSYLTKRRGPDAAIAVSATLPVKPLLLQAAAGVPIEVRAASAAQAFGGSVEAFALTEVETEEEAEAAIDEEGFDGLYRAARVPLEVFGDD
jgi:Putative Flp pilus-assembly TadE/G-like